MNQDSADDNSVSATEKCEMPACQMRRVEERIDHKSEKPDQTDQDELDERAENLSQGELTF